MDNCSLKMERDHVRVEFQGSETFAVEHLIPVLSKIDWNEKVADAGSQFDRNLAIRTTHAICMRIGHKPGADLFLSAAAKLSLIDGVTRFSRNQLHHEAKSARDCLHSTAITRGARGPSFGSPPCGAPNAATATPRPSVWWTRWSSCASLPTTRAR